MIAEQSEFTNHEFPEDDIETRVLRAQKDIQNGFYLLGDALHWHGITIDQYNSYKSSPEK